MADKGDRSTDESPRRLVAVRARGLRKAYGPIQAVDGIDLDIRQRECFGFLGPNGAGKSTTMRMLSCLSPRDGGELSVLGYDPARDARALKARLGVVSQDVTLDLELTVRENLLVFARYFEIPRADAARRADELLELMGLTERRDEAVDRLSGGMKRRLQIARALMSRPRLVLLDEPTTGLDPQARHVVWDRLRELAGGGATLVLTTHYMDEAAQLCDRLAVIDRAVVVREGTPAELVADVVGREVLELQVPAGRAGELVERLAGLPRHHETLGDLVRLFADDGAAVVAAVRQSGVGAELRATRPASLEDVFLALTGRSLRD